MPTDLPLRAGTCGPSRCPDRAYGNSGDRLSVVGLGGAALTGLERATASRVVARAVERGLNCFDVAPSYGDAELRLARGARVHVDHRLRHGRA